MKGEVAPASIFDFTLAAGQERRKAGLELTANRHLGNVGALWTSEILQSTFGRSRLRFCFIVRAKQASNAS